MHRFFLPPNAIKGSNVSISGSPVHQLSHVLRLAPGDSITVLDNSGWEYEVELTSLQADVVKGSVRRKSLSATEPRTKVTLYQSLMKGAKFEHVLQKATELGVVGFVPVVAERCVSADANSVSDAKLNRWEKIILEAAEQSRRGKLPRLLRPVLFRTACQASSGLSLLLWEGEKTTSLKSALQAREDGKDRPQRPFSVNLFIGPEGGFTDNEVDFAQSKGFIPVTLGPRILRAETASIVAAAVVLFELGDLGG